MKLRTLIEEVKRLRRHPIVVLTDRDYADGISLFSDNEEHGHGLLNRVELKYAKVGLRLNPKKTEVITIIIVTEQPPVTTMGGTSA